MGSAQLSSSVDSSRLDQLSVLVWWSHLGGISSAFLFGGLISVGSAQLSSLVVSSRWDQFSFIVWWSQFRAEGNESENRRFLFERIRNYTIPFEMGYPLCVVEYNCTTYQG